MKNPEAIVNHQLNSESLVNQICQNWGSGKKIVMAGILLNLLFLSGKYLAQVAGQSLLLVYNKSTKFQQRLLNQYEAALRMTGPEENVFEVLHSRVEDTNFGAGLANYRTDCENCNNNYDGIDNILNTQQFVHNVTTTEVEEKYVTKRNRLGDETPAFNSLVQHILSEQVLRIINTLKCKNVAVSKKCPGILHTNSNCTVSSVIPLNTINTTAQFPKSDLTSLYLVDNKSKTNSNEFIKDTSENDVAAIMQEIHNGNLTQNKNIAIISKLLKVIDKACLSVQGKESSCKSLLSKEHGVTCRTGLPTALKPSLQFQDDIQNNFATKENPMESSNPVNFTHSLAQQNEIKRGSNILKFPEFLKKLPQLVHALRNDFKEKEKQRQGSASELAKANCVQDNGTDRKALASSGALQLINVLNTICMNCLIHFYDQPGNEYGQSNASRQRSTDSLCCKCDAFQKRSQSNFMQQLKSDRQENAESFRQSNSFFISRSSYIEQILNMQNEIDFDHLLHSLQTSNKIGQNLQLMEMLNSINHERNSGLILPFGLFNQFLHEWNSHRNHNYSFYEHMLRKPLKNCNIEYVIRSCLFEAPGFKGCVGENVRCKALAELCPQLTDIQKKLIFNATGWNLLDVITTLSKNRQIAKDRHIIQPTSSTINRMFSKAFFGYKENPWRTSNGYNAAQLHLLDSETTKRFVANILNSGQQRLHYFAKTPGNSEIKTVEDGGNFTKSCLDAIVQLQNAANLYVTDIRNINYQALNNLHQIMQFTVVEQPKMRDDQTLCTNGPHLYKPTKRISLCTDGKYNETEKYSCRTSVKPKTEATQDFANLKCMNNLTFKHLQLMIHSMMGKSKTKEDGWKEVLCSSEKPKIHSDFSDLLVLPLIEKLFIDVIIKSQLKLINCSLKRHNSNCLDTIMQLQDGVDYYFSDLKYINYLTSNKFEQIMQSLAEKSMEVGKWKEILCRPEKGTGNNRILNFSELIVLKHLERQVADMLIYSLQHPKMLTNKKSKNVFIQPKETSNSFVTINKLRKGSKPNETADNTKKDTFIKSCSNQQKLRNNSEPKELNKKTTFSKENSETIGANFPKQRHFLQDIENKLNLQKGSEIQALELSEHASAVIQRNYSTGLTRSQLGNTHLVMDLVKTSFGPLLDINFTLASLQLKRKLSHLDTLKIIDYLSTCLCQVASLHNILNLHENTRASSIKRKNNFITLTTTLHGVYTARKDGNLDGVIKEQASIIDINKKVFDDLETHIRTIKIIDKPKKSDEKSEENDPADKDEDDSANRHFSKLPPLLLKSHNVVLSPVSQRNQSTKVDCLKITRKPSVLKNGLLPPISLDGYKQLLRMEIDKDIISVLKKSNYSIDKVVALILPKRPQSNISTQLIQTIPIEALAWLCEQLTLEKDVDNSTIEQQIVNNYRRLYKSFIVILTSNLHVATHMERCKVKNMEHFQTVLIAIHDKLQPDTKNKKTATPNQTLLLFEHLQLCSIIERMHKENSCQTLDIGQDRQPTGGHVWNKPPIYFKKNLDVSIFPENTIWNAYPKLLQPLRFEIKNVSKQIQVKHYLPKTYRYETKEVDLASGDKIKITRLVRVKADA